MNKILKNVQAEFATSGLAGQAGESQPAGEEQYLAAHKRQLSYLFKIGQKYYRPGAKFLDIGSSFGYPCFGAKLIGYDSYGLDRPERVAEFSKRFKRLGINNVASDLALKKSPFSSRKFDVILVSEIPETVNHQPERFFSEIARLLKPGGILIMTAANLLRFNNMAKIVPARGGRPSAKNLPANYYCEFTASDLAYLLTKNGLNVEKIKYRNFNHQRVTWLSRAFNNLSGLLLPHRKKNLVVTARK